MNFKFISIAWYRDVVFAVIVVPGHQEQVLHHAGIAIIRYVILAISNGIKDSHVQSVIKLIDQSPTKKWSSAVIVISKYILAYFVVKNFF